MTVIFYRFGSFWVEPTFQFPHSSKTFLFDLLLSSSVSFVAFSVNFTLSTPIGSSRISSSTLNFVALFSFHSLYIN
jgi:hypothetical protein